jgi:lipopolysaccharide export system permease protein
VFTFVLLLGNVLKEVLALLVNQQASFGTLAYAVGLLVPYVLVFALPMGMLTATLLTFGRFSADNELTAVRASGISLLSVCAPILGFSLLLCVLCAFINLQFAPQCRLAYKRLIDRAPIERLERLLPERTFIRLAGGSAEGEEKRASYTLYFGRLRDGELRNVRVYQIERGGTNLLSVIDAPSGTLSIDRTNKSVHLLLRDAWLLTLHEGERQPVFFSEVPLDLTVPVKAEKEASLGDLTFAALWEKRRELKAQGLDTTPVDVQIHSQVAFSFACFAFTLIGIPLGVRAHRRETSVGIAIALAFVVLYYGFLILGQSLETRAALRPYLIVWLPNFVFQIAGLILLRKVNRGV